MEIYFIKKKYQNENYIFGNGNFNAAQDGVKSWRVFNFAQYLFLPQFCCKVSKFQDIIIQKRFDEMCSRHANRE